MPNRTPEQDEVVRNLVRMVKAAQDAPENDAPRSAMRYALQELRSFPMQLRTEEISFPEGALDPEWEGDATADFTLAPANVTLGMQRIVLRVERAFWYRSLMAGERAVTSATLLQESTMRVNDVVYVGFVPIPLHNRQERDAVYEFVQYALRFNGVEVSNYSLGVEEAQEPSGYGMLTELVGRARARVFTNLVATVFGEQYDEEDED